MQNSQVQSTVETGRTPHWGAAIWAGLAAGVVFMMLEMLMLMFFAGQSPWGPVRMMAAIVLGPEVLPPPATFDLGIAMTAMAVHFPLSILYGLLIALMIFRLREGSGLAIGAAFGLAVYFINFYGMTAIFPWFANARGWISLVAHLLFGLVAAWVYKEIVKRKIRHT